MTHYKNQRKNLKIVQSDGSIKIQQVSCLVEIQYKPLKESFDESRNDEITSIVKIGGEPCFQSDVDGACCLYSILDGRTRELETVCMESDGLYCPDIISRSEFMERNPEGWSFSIEELFSKYNERKEHNKQYKKSDLTTGAHATPAQRKQYPKVIKDEVIKKAITNWIAAGQTFMQEKGDYPIAGGIIPSAGHREPFTTLNERTEYTSDQFKTIHGVRCKIFASLIAEQVVEMNYCKQGRDSLTWNTSMPNSGCRKFLADFPADKILAEVEKQKSDLTTGAYATPMQKIKTTEGPSSTPSQPLQKELEAIQQLGQNFGDAWTNKLQQTSKGAKGPEEKTPRL